MESNPSPKKKEESTSPTSSLPVEVFLEKEEISQFKCELCGKIPYYENAIEAICCGRLFCSSCLEEKISLGGNCTICNKSYITNKHSKIISNVLKKYKISCPNGLGGGCEWQGKWADLSSHFEECEKSFRFCNYKKFGCEFFGTYKQCKEHEDAEVQKHFDQVLEYNEQNVIKNDLQVRFDYGMTYKVDVHEHPLKFQESSTWTCNGVKLKGGCMSPRPDFKTTYRFRCNECDFDLCPYCMMKHATEQIRDGDNNEDED